MYKLDVTNENGEVLSLNPSEKYTIQDVSGLASNKATINYSDVAGGDGGFYSSSHVDVRNIVFMIHVEHPIEQNRINLYKYFKLGKSVDIHFTNDSRDVRITGYIDSFDTSLFEMSQVIQISVLCLKPFFRDADAIVTYLSQVLDMFEFPFDIDEEGEVFSEIDKTHEVVIANTGETDTGVIITMTATGTVVDPIIYDATNRTSLALDITMQLGDSILINTNRGEKSIILTRNGVQSNIINNLVAGSTWFTLEPGETVFAYETSQGDEFLSITFNHYNNYEGV